MQERLCAETQQQQALEAIAAAAIQQQQQQQRLAMEQQQQHLQQQQFLQQPEMAQTLEAMGPQIMPHGGDNWIMAEGVEDAEASEALAVNTPEQMRAWIRNAYHQMLTTSSPQEAINKLLETAKSSGNPDMEQMVMEESATFGPTHAPPQ